MTDTKPTIYLGADHAGFELKESLKTHLESAGYPIHDLGAKTLDPADDFPQFATAVGTAVAGDPGSLGVLSCGNAEGICMAANKVRGVRAGIGFSVEAARTMRTDDDANILCIPGRVPIIDQPTEVLTTFLTTPFSGADRHVRRLTQMKKLENE